MVARFFLWVLLGCLVSNLSMGAVSGPKSGDQQELHLSFDQAENEVLGMFQRDLPRLEALGQKLAIFEASVSGALPANYSSSLRNKLERIVLTSNKLRLVDCPQCQA